MPPAKENSQILTDDFVAEVLAQEASDCALKYSDMGMETFNRQAKRPANQPKPNTRFLTNIIRDTNSHNRTLLAKEAAESRARLMRLEDAGQRKTQVDQQRLKRQRPGLGDLRKRMLGDIHSTITGVPPRRRRLEDGQVMSAQQPPQPKHNKSGNGSVKGSAKAVSQQSHRDSRRDLFPESDERARSHRGRGDIADVRDPGKSSSARQEGGLMGEKVSRRPASHRLEPIVGSEDSSDSDPLDEIIGPQPLSPVQKRGRGATIKSSGINNRFASDYDPKADVSIEDDDDWGSALEAHRDRLKWKQQGAERLRAAGFTEAAVSKWEKAGKDDKSEPEVTWSKKGEEREWDRGKGDNTKTAKAAWTQLVGNGGLGEA